MTILVALVADLHVGSTIGLLTGPVKLDDGGTYQPTREQGWIAECWADFWQWVDDERRAIPGARIVSVVDGDCVDANKHSKFQLFTPNPDTILEAGIAALEKPRIVSEVVHIIRGTEAHSGGSAHLEVRLAKDIGSPPAWWRLRMDLEGERFDVTHHPGTNSRIAELQGAAADREAFRVWTAYQRMHLPPPHMVARAHVHHWAPPGRFEETECLYLPPWQLCDAYATRQGFGTYIEPVGGVLCWCEAGHLRWKDRRYAPEIGKVWTLS